MKVVLDASFGQKSSYLVIEVNSNLWERMFSFLASLSSREPGPKCSRLGIPSENRTSCTIFIRMT